MSTLDPVTELLQDFRSLSVVNRLKYPLIKCDAKSAWEAAGRSCFNLESSRKWQNKGAQDCRKREICEKTSHDDEVHPTSAIKVKQILQCHGPYYVSSRPSDVADTPTNKKNSAERLPTIPELIGPVNASAFLGTNPTGEPITTDKYLRIAQRVSGHLI